MVVALSIFTSCHISVLLLVSPEPIVVWDVIGVVALVILLSAYQLGQ
jgi:hypothetical protein